MKKLALMMIFTALGLPLGADELVENELIDLYGSEEFISIATGYKQAVSKAPAVASVIDAKQIRRMGATDIDEVLEAIPGLHVSNNFQGYFPIYTIRGIYSNFNPQVLVLIDGVPQTNLFTGGKNFVWGGMPVEAISRVEVIRGPGSAIYGADAFSGVINIITKGGGDSSPLNEAGIRYGSFDTKNVFASTRKSWGDSNLYLSAQFYKTAGHDEVVDRDFQSYLDDLTGTAASHAPGAVSMSRENLDINLDYRWGDLTVKGFYQGRRDWGAGAGIAQALDPSSRYQSDRYQLSFDYMLPDITEDLTIGVSGSYLDVSQENAEDALLFPAGSTGPFGSFVGGVGAEVFPHGVIGNPEVYEKHSRFNSTLHYKGIDRHDLSVGVGYYYGDLYRVEEEKNYCTNPASCTYILPRLQSSRLVDVSDTPYVFLREGDRENHYFYIQDIFTFADGWELTAGVRYDNYSDFGETVNPRLALVWSTSNDLTTKFLYGEAFRAPSFAETKAINNPTSLGNAALEPETLRSFEIVLDYRADYNLDLVFNTFYYEWDDIILFIPDASGSTATAQNFGRQTGYGFELETTWKPMYKVEILANYAWQRSTNTRTDADSANAPGQQFYVQANWEFSPASSVNLQANWVLERKREAADPRDDIDDHIVFDLTLRRQNIWRRVDAALMVKNIFDEDVREPTPNGFPVPGIPNDLPLAGRTVVGEVRFNF